MKKLLLIGLSIIALTLTSCESKTLKSCKKIYKQQEKFVKNCDDCVELENFYITTGEQWGWEDYKYFIGLYAPEEFDLSVLDVLDNEERTTLKKIHISLKNTVDIKLKSMNCCSKDLILYKYAMKAKKMIKEYLLTSDRFSGVIKLEQFKPYELEEIYINKWNQDPEYISKNKAYEKLKAFMEFYKDYNERRYDVLSPSEREDYINKYNQYVEKRQEIKEWMADFRKKFQPYVCGYSMKVFFVFENEFGGKSKTTETFIFDPEFTSVHVLGEDD